MKKTNRFFWSEQQNGIDEMFEPNKVFNGKEWVSYSEWVSKDFMDKTCNWDDAVLVYETQDDNPKIQIDPDKIKYHNELFNF